MGNACNVQSSFMLESYFALGGKRNKADLGLLSLFAPGTLTAIRTLSTGLKIILVGFLSFVCRTSKVPCYSIPERAPRCLVYLLDLYFKKLPRYAFEEGVLYLCPKLVVPSSDDEPWYDCIPVGRNTLSSMVKVMCIEAGINSLRATRATCLFNVGVPEQIIQKKLDIARFQLFVQAALSSNPCNDVWW